jgi:hypothetical protein
VCGIRVIGMGLMAKKLIKEAKVWAEVAALMIMDLEYTIRV